MNITNSEFKKFLIVLAFLLFWFSFGISMVTPYILGNYIIAYSVFIVIDTFLVMKYILLIDPFKELSKFFAMILIFIATDVVMFPYLVTPAGLATSEPNALMSSDVFLWNLIPSSIPPLIKYYLVYVIIVGILLFVARGLTTKKFFWSNLKNGA